MPHTTQIMNHSLNQTKEYLIHTCSQKLCLTCMNHLNGLTQLDDTIISKKTMS